MGSPLNHRLLTNRQALSASSSYLNLERRRSYQNHTRYQIIVYSAIGLNSFDKDATKVQSKNPKNIKRTLLFVETGHLISEKRSNEHYGQKRKKSGKREHNHTKKCFEKTFVKRIDFDSSRSLKKKDNYRITLTKHTCT
uniref:Uncharacterized protein n=1 Tax=Romanomermis culicivorax TaxID=13658 RepID=A0A915HFD2_ROMCU